MREFHARWTVPGNAVLSVFGDVDPEELRQLLETHLAGWKDQPRPALPVLASVTPTPRSEESREKEQAVLALGFPGTSLSSPDRFALELIQEACSDMGSRLFMRIRDELGLAYYVGASLLTGQTPGYFAFYCGTAPEKIELVEKDCGPRRKSSAPKASAMRNWPEPRPRSLANARSAAKTSEGSP